MKFNRKITEENEAKSIFDKYGQIGSIFFPVGGSTLQDAMHDFRYAKYNPYAIVLSDFSDYSDKSVVKEIERLEPIKRGGNREAVVYDSESSQSQKLFYSHAIQDFIQNNLDKLVKANGKPIESAALQYFAGQDLDAFVGIQHCIILNPRITKDGYFEGTIIDYYDFDHREVEGSLKERAFAILNNFGHAEQESGNLNNYALIYNIRMKI